MTITVVRSDEELTAAAARRDFAKACTDARVFFLTHQDAHLPGPGVWNVRVEGESREEKLRNLRAIAASWDVPLVTVGGGTQIARLVFGPLQFEAHVGAEWKGTQAHLDAARARRAGSEAAA